VEILATYFSLTESTYSLCCYVLELILLDSKYVYTSRVLLAVSSLFLSLKILDPSQWNPTVLLIVDVDK
jgi:hypothetical protein